MSGKEQPGGSALVDWAELRARMQRVSQALTVDRELTPTQVGEVLEERARKLAQAAAAAPEEGVLEVVRFGRGDDQYALESRYIHEVLPLSHVCFLPGVSAPVVGAVAWRGQALVLMDVGRDSGALPAEGHVLVVGGERPAFGILADALAGLVRVSPTALGDLGAAGIAERVGVRGLTDEGVLVLDGAGLLQSYR